MAGTGGRRQGAGRKPKPVEQHMTERRQNFAAGILSDELEKRYWQQALQSENEKISFDALKALTEFKRGKAKETVESKVTLCPVLRLTK